MRKRVHDAERSRILTPKLFIALLLGALLAVLAFSQAAASVGLPIATFRPLGAGFFSMRTVQIEASKRLVSPDRRATPVRADAIGRQGLIFAPLNTRALWLVGQSLAEKGQVGKARIAMRQAETVSRRDAAVQMWLGLDNLRNRRVPPALRNFDLMIRTNAEAAALVTPALAKVIVSPEGRRQMAPYFKATNPWLPDLMWAAANQVPQAAPLAQLLLEQRGMAPDGEGLRPIYAGLLKRLLDQKAYGLAVRLYPKLPGASLASLRSLNPTIEGKVQENYPPFVWGIGEGDAQGGGLIGLPQGGVGLELFGSPGTIGVATSKLLVPDAHGSFRWRTLERTGNSEGSANWELTCLLGKSAGTKTSSADLFSEKLPLNRVLSMPIPGNCRLVRIDLRIAGGVGRNPAELVVGDFALDGTPTTIRSRS
jgi:hypothetical protein